MLLTAIENFVLIATVLALAGFFLAWAARHATERKLWRPRPDTMARFYAAVLVTPPVISLWLVAASLLPKLWLGQTAFDAAHPTPQHELHLLGDLTVSLEPALAYGTLLFVVAAVLFAAWSSVRGLVRVGRVIRQLEWSAPAPPQEQIALVNCLAARHGIDVGLVMSDYPLSFVWGFRRSKLVLSSGLLRTLTPEELSGVLEHEAAHHERRDNLFKLALVLCGYTSLAFLLSRLILRWRAAEVEMVCDEVAAARTSTPLEIADALVKLRRRTLVTGVMSVPTASSFVPEDAPTFERRVRRLISFSDAMPDSTHVINLSRANSSTLIIAGAVFTVTLLIVSIFAPLAVHHAAESLIRLFT